MNLEAAVYMIPVGISDAGPEAVVPAGTLEAMRGIRHFIVENVRTARRWLRRCTPGCDIDSMTFSELSRHTRPEEIPAMLEPLRRGEPVGVMSEAGCPGVADPGAQVVSIAQREGFRVVPLVGPSSLLLALMASGFNGQGFTFNGYLPIADSERTAAIRRLEKTARNHGVTQIFIETPYRNRKMLDTLVATLRPDTLLCVAVAITDPEHQQIVTLPAAKWKNRKIELEKQPAVFLIG